MSIRGFLAKVFGFAVALIFVLVPFAADARIFEALVVGVSDGDTVTVLTENKRQVKVRLYGIDCPESKQAFGTRAKQFTSRLVFKRWVNVNAVDKDRYGRTVGVITTRDGVVLNQELVANGLAWVYKAHCKGSVCKRWKRVEKSARMNRVGLWSDPNAVPPWEFRKAKRNITKHW